MIINFGAQSITTELVRDFAIFDKEFRVTFISGVSFHYYYRTKEEAIDVYNKYLNIVSEPYKDGVLQGYGYVNLGNWSNTPFK